MWVTWHWHCLLLWLQPRAWIRAQNVAPSSHCYNSSLTASKNGPAGDDLRCNTTLGVVPSPRFSQRCWCPSEKSTFLLTLKGAEEHSDMVIVWMLLLHWSGSSVDREERGLDPYPGSVRVTDCMSSQSQGVANPSTNPLHNGHEELQGAAVQKFTTGCDCGFCRTKKPTVQVLGQPIF